MVMILGAVLFDERILGTQKEVEGEATQKPGKKKKEN
ncbi:hypothetical protein V6Z11_A05G143500 [Gossypium hirsutum]